MNEKIMPLHKKITAEMKLKTILKNEKCGIKKMKNRGCFCVF